MRYLFLVRRFWVGIQWVSKLIDWRDKVSGQFLDQTVNFEHSLFFMLNTTIGIKLFASNLFFGLNLIHCQNFDEICVFAIFCAGTFLGISALASIPFFDLSLMFYQFYVIWHSHFWPKVKTSFVGFIWVQWQILSDGYMGYPICTKGINLLRLGIETFPWMQYSVWWYSKWWPIGFQFQFG